MRLTEVTICWTPNRPEFPSATRGKYAVFPAASREDVLSAYARRSDPNDARARDRDPRKQALYMTYIFYQMTQLDKVAVTVKELSRHVEEALSKRADH